MLFVVSRSSDAVKQALVEGNGVKVLGDWLLEAANPGENAAAERVLGTMALHAPVSWGFQARGGPAEQAPVSANVIAMCGTDVVSAHADASA